jgi:hypothetical protein
MRAYAFFKFSAFSMMGAALVTSAAVLSSGCSSPDGNTAGGVAAADVVLTAAATTDIGSAFDKTFTVLNQGAGDATLETITTAGLGLSGPYTLDSSTCQNNTILHGGKSETCTLTVKFAPTTLTKTYTDLVVQYTDATQETAQSNPIQWEKLNIYVTPPIRHGRKIRPIVRKDARQRMDQMVRPRLRYSARKLQVAALPTK